VTVEWLPPFVEGVRQHIRVGVQGDCATQHRYGLSPSCVLFASYRSSNAVRDLGAVLTIMVQHAETSPRACFGTPKHSHEQGSARRNIPTSLFRYAEALPRSRFGTPKHPHEPVSVRVRRAERRAEPCVRRAEATQSAETSFTAVSACTTETAFRRRTSAEICHGAPNSRRTGVSAPKRRRNGTPERRNTACFSAETARMPCFSATKICLKPLVGCTAAQGKMGYKPEIRREYDEVLRAAMNDQHHQLLRDYKAQ